MGFKNDSGGYELRNGLNFKGKTSNGITTIEKGSNSVALFEGFFDFLSALEYYQLSEPNITTIVLNTTHNLKVALPRLKEAKKINLFLDNDNAGESAKKKLHSEGLQIIDNSMLYSNHKDFNSYLMALWQLSKDFFISFK